jgi:hypothetical protein
MLVAPDTKKLYGSLRDKRGEIVQFAFNEQFLNATDFSLALGLSVSVSAGDLKRLPVVNRLCLTKQILTDSGLKFLSSHLSLNGKFINIERNRLKDLIFEMFPNNGEDIFNQLNGAFRPREILSIDEPHSRVTPNKPLKPTNRDFPHYNWILDQRT